MAEEKAEEGPPSPTPPPSEPAPPPLENPAHAEEKEDWENRFKYLFADFENFRKRASKERDALRRTVRADVVLSLIPTYEAALRARDAVGRLPAADPIRRGIDLLVGEFMMFLDAEHVTAVARAGEPFRAEWHEAVAEAPTREDASEATVVEVVQQGYRIDSLLLRPAKVVVARSLTAAGSSAETSAAAGEPDASDSG